MWYLVCKLMRGPLCENHCFRMQLRAFSCRHNEFALLPLDITHGSFVRKQVVATSICCYLSLALSNGLICSHALKILFSISVRPFVANRTVLSCISCCDHTYHKWRLDHRLIRVWFDANPTAHHRSYSFFTIYACVDDL